MDADLKRDHPARGELLVAEVRPHAGAGHLQDRGIVSGLLRFAQDAINPPRHLHPFRTNRAETHVINVDVRRAGVGQQRDARLDRDFRELGLPRLPERVEIRRFDLRRDNLVRGERRGRRAAISAARHLGGDRTAQKPGLRHRAAVDHEPLKWNRGSFHRNRHHLGSGLVAYGHAVDRLVIGGDGDLKPHRFAQLVGPVAVVGRHAHLDGGGAEGGLQRHGRDGHRSAARAGTDGEDEACNEEGAGGAHGRKTQNRPDIHACFIQ